MQRGNTLPQLPIGKDSERAALENARQALGEILVSASDGRRVPVADLAKMELVEGPASVSREWMRRRVIVQAVHMMYEGDHGARWGDARRHSKIVVIGRDLDRAELQEGFRGCRALHPA